MSKQNFEHPFPEPLNISCETSMEVEFRRFETQWNLYAKDACVDQLDPSRAKSTLLTALGPDCARLYQTFKLTPEEQLTATAVLAAIGRNLIGNNSSKLQRRAQFNSQSRYANEPYFRYLRRLRQKLDGCNYGELEDDVLLDRIIASITNEALSLELCYMENLTLDQAIERCLKEDKPKPLAQSKINHQPKTRNKRVGKKINSSAEIAESSKMRTDTKTKDDDKKHQKVDGKHVGQEETSKTRRKQTNDLREHSNIRMKKPEATIGKTKVEHVQVFNNKSYASKSNSYKDNVRVLPEAVTCLQCGNSRKGLDHMANPTLCPAHGTLCKKCNEYNHLPSQCDARRGLSSK